MSFKKLIQKAEKVEFAQVIKERKNAPNLAVAYDLLLLAFRTNLLTGSAGKGDQFLLANAPANLKRLLKNLSLP